MLLKGQTALITGAGGGIGRALAERFASEGARVALADINAAGMEEVVELIQAAGGEALPLLMDVTDESSVMTGVAEMIERWDRLDIAVANAGVQHIAPVHKLSYADWQRVLDVHLNGAFLLTRAALNQMYEQKCGTMLYMGSVHSLEASPLKAPYVAAKHGLLGLCRTVAREGAEHGVRSNIICPGYVRTPLVEQQIPKQALELGLSEEAVVSDVMLRQTVDGEFTTLEDVALVAVQLAAFPSSALTGQSVVVSHGWHMQ